MSVRGLRIVSVLALLIPVACGDDANPVVAEDTTGSGTATTEPGDDNSSSGAGSTDTDGDAGTDTSSTDDGSTSDTTGDSTTSTTGDGDGDGDGDGEPADYGQTGPFSFQTATRSQTVPNGCALDYEVLTPDAPTTDVVVVLAHGFQRSVETMRPVAEHFASWGMTVVNAPLCSNAFAGVDHARNGEALAQLAAIEAPNGALFSGFSAGGLAAFLGAAQYTNTVAFVGLDPVDSGDLGLGAVPPVTFPIVATLGDPQSCNSSGNWVPVINANPSFRAVRIPGAAHFDFETDACAPGDIVCFCRPAGGDIHIAAWRMVTAAAVWHSGADPLGEAWWTVGSPQHLSMVNDGLLAEIQ